MKCYKSKWILTSENEILKDYALVIDEGKIVDLIPNSEVNFEDKKVIVESEVDCTATFKFIKIRNTNYLVDAELVEL